MVRKKPGKASAQVGNNPDPSKKLKRPASMPADESALKLFDRIAEEVLHQERAMFDSLTDYERNLVVRWLSDALVDGGESNEIHNLLWELDYYQKPVSIHEFIHNDYFLGRSCADLHPRWKEDLSIVFSPGSPIFEWVACLTGDTAIPLLDGSMHTLEELYVQFEKDRKPFWVYSIDQTTGEVVPGECSKVTRFREDDVFTVTFEDGTSVRANADHEFVCRDGVKRRLRDLKVDDRLMPFTTRHQRQKGQRLHDGYEQTYMPGPQVYAYTHRIVGRMLAGGTVPKSVDGDRAVLHHKDFKCSNNDPSNLVWMGFAAHRELHRVAGSSARSDSWRKKVAAHGRAACTDPDSPLRQAHAKFMRSAAGRKLSAQNLKKANLTPEDYRERTTHATEVRWSDPKQHEQAAKRCRARSIGNDWGRRSSRVRRDLTVDRIYTTYADCESLGDLYVSLQASRNAVVRVLSDAGLTIADLKSNYRNHRIVSIEPAGRARVYCLTIPAHGNFAITTDLKNRCGVFSGNTGSIGTGKTTLACVAMARKLYELSCLRNPAAYYGLLTDSLIVFGVYSITKRQVADAGYFKLRGLIDSSPYFRTEFPRSPKIDSKLDFQRTTGRAVMVVPGCVAAGTLVETSTGRVAIESLAGDVLTTDDARILHSTRFSRVIPSGRKSCLLIRTDRGQELTCSHDHRILSTVASGSPAYRKAKDLREGDRVFVLPSHAGSVGVLQDDGRQADGAVSRLHQAQEQRALSRDENLRGQTCTFDRRTEDVSGVSQAEASFGVRAQTSAHSHLWHADVPEVVVQVVRDWSGAAVLPGELFATESVRQEATLTFGVEGLCSEAVEDLLRGEPGFDLGSRRITRRPFQAECTPEALAERKSGQGACSESPLDAAVSREGSGTISQVREDRKWTSCSSSSGTETRGSKAGFTGHAYFLGRAVPGGVFWERVLLLWTRDLSHDFGSCSAVASPRRDDSTEHGAVLSLVQQQQELQAVVEVASRAVRLEHAGDPDTTFGLQASRVVAIEDVGERETFDLLDVDSASHSYVASGVVCKNSQELHALGLDLFSYMMDEVNFMRVKDDKEAGVQIGQAYDLYNATYTRLQSRFIRPGGTLPGLMLLLSSRNAQTSFLEEHLKKVKGQASTYVSDYALWEVKPAHRFTQKHFLVEVGDRVSSSRLLGEDEVPRKGVRVVDVPGEFRKPFTEDVDQALRDIAGIATFNLSPLIRDRQSVFDAMRPDMKHPFTREIAVISTDDDLTLDQLFRLKDVARSVASNWQPILNPTAPRYMHVDIGLSGDALGLAMGHVAGMAKVSRLNADGTEYLASNPYIVIDLMLRVVAPPGGEVDLSKIRAFILYLSKLFTLNKVTFDGFQSADVRQILMKQGLETALLSVDRDDAAYLSLRSALFDRRIAYYKYQPFENEALDLERDAKKGKVDHPSRATTGGKGSKDVADGVGGVVYLLMTEEHSHAGRMLPELDRTILAKQAPTGPPTLHVAAREVVVSEVRRVNRTGPNWTDLRKNV